MCLRLRKAKWRLMYSLQIPLGKQSSESYKQQVRTLRISTFLDVHLSQVRSISNIELRERM